GWKKPDCWKTSPNLVKMINQFNTEVRWVQTTLLQEKKLARRIRFLMKFIDIAYKCQQIRNFHTLAAIHSALIAKRIMNLPVFFFFSSLLLLHIIYIHIYMHMHIVDIIQWDGLKVQQRESWDKFQNLFDWKKDALFELQERCESPAIPYLPLFCAQFFKIEESQEYKLGDGSINRRKLQLLVQRAERFVQYKQVIGYHFPIKYDYQSLLLKEWKELQNVQEEHLEMLADLVGRNAKLNKKI
ncbi:Ras guanine nucleotide exchange factor, partial [Reticulomyxa filosa]